MAACLPVAAAIGGLALDDDALAAKRTWFANHWVGCRSWLSRSILRICILCCSLIGFLGRSLSEPFDWFKGGVPIGHLRKAISL